jgi:hypothetical protein
MIPKKVIKKAKTEMRTGTIPFKGEELTVVGLPGGVVQAVNSQYRIDELNIKLAFYTERLNNAKTTDSLKLELMRIISETQMEINKNANIAFRVIMRKQIQKPPEWFGTLSMEDTNALITKLRFWNLFIDVDELYQEIYRHALYTFQNSKASKSMTGLEAAEYMMKIEEEYVTLKKKSKCLYSALLAANMETAETVIQFLQNGLSESSSESETSAQPASGLRAEDSMIKNKD